MPICPPTAASWSCSTSIAALNLDRFLRPNADVAISRILPPGPQTYRTVVITNRDDMHGDMIERVIEAGGTSEQTRALGLSYPDGLFSLSHVALPFPMSDALYGMTPDKSEDFGLSLGTLAPRGERNVLVASLDALLRASSIPSSPICCNASRTACLGERKVRAEINLALRLLLRVAGHVGLTPEQTGSHRSVPLVGGLTFLEASRSSDKNKLN